jgi:pyruvate ferredoxin oxidoreductase gamma subunit
MFQVRFHGRGGQGVVTAAEMLSLAAFLDGKHAQAFPSFGSERTGAPVVSFCKISDGEIRSREPITEPDALVIQDPTLLQTAGVFDGLKPEGVVVINSGKKVSELGLGQLLGKIPNAKVISIPATELAMKHFKRPMPNAVMLGGLAAMIDAVKMESVLDAIAKTFAGAVGEKNVAAATEAYEAVSANKKEAKA